MRRNFVGLEGHARCLAGEVAPGKKTSRFIRSMKQVVTRMCTDERAFRSDKFKRLLDFIWPFPKFLGKKQKQKKVVV